MQDKSTPNTPETTLDTALAIHNAKHAESPLHDIADALDTAAANRPLTLVRDLWRFSGGKGNREWLQNVDTTIRKEWQ